MLSTQDKEILSILEELENKNNVSNINSQSRLTGYFCSNTVSNLSRKVLSNTEIKILEKGLDCAPIHNRVNEPELRQDFGKFSRKMRLKWYFRNEATEDFSETSSFRFKSSWKPPQGNASLKLFLSQIERELFEIPKKRLDYSNFSKEEWECMRSLANDRSIIIKTNADKGSCVVVWDREDYIAVAEKQLSDKNVYRDVNFKSKILKDLAETSNNIFKNL